MEQGELIGRFCWGSSVSWGVEQKAVIRAFCRVGRFRLTHVSPSIAIIPLKAPRIFHLNPDHFSLPCTRTFEATDPLRPAKKKRHRTLPRGGRGRACPSGFGRLSSPTPRRSCGRSPVQASAPKPNADSSHQLSGVYHTPNATVAFCPRMGKKTGRGINP